MEGKVEQGRAGITKESSDVNKSISYQAGIGWWQRIACRQEGKKITFYRTRMERYFPSLDIVVLALKCSL